MRSQLSLLAGIALLAGGTGFAQEAKPSPRECVPSDSSMLDGKLAGFIWHAEGEVAVPAARIALESVVQGAESPTTDRATTASDAEGRFWFCDVPAGALVTLQAEALDGGVGTATLVMPDDFARHDLRIRKQLGAGVGSLAVRILDGESRRPVGEAVLRIPEAERVVVADEQGRAQISDLPAGTLEVEVQHIAYGQQRSDVEVRNGHTHSVEIHLVPRPLVMEPIAVTVEFRPAWLARRGFYERQEKGLGYHLSPEDIERRNPTRFSHLLEAAPGVRLMRVCNPNCNIVLRTDAARGRACSPEIYLDGKKLRLPALFSLESLPVWDVAAVEMYTRISQTPAEFYGLCGSLVIWTKRLGR